MFHLHFNLAHVDSIFFKVISIITIATTMKYIRTSIIRINHDCLNQTGLSNQESVEVTIQREGIRQLI